MRRLPRSSGSTELADSGSRTKCGLATAFRLKPEATKNARESEAGRISAQEKYSEVVQPGVRDDVHDDAAAGGVNAGYRTVRASPSPVEMWGRPAGSIRSNLIRIGGRGHT